jgi:hypothetical protein
VFRLALALGLPVRELLSRIGSDELTEWMAYYQIDPFGDYRADVRSGVVAATFANANRAPNAKVFTPEDFMPFVAVHADRLKPAATAESERAAANVAQFKAMFAHRLKPTTNED